MYYQKVKRFIATIFALILVLYFPCREAVAAGTQITYSYDSNGRLTTVTVGANKKITHTYDKNGNVTQANTILSPLLRLDAPAANANISSTGNVKISGWLLNQGGSTKVEIYENNVLLDTITSFVTREDVYRTYPEYDIHNAGYLTNLTFSEGAHTIKIVGTGKDGKQTSLTRSFNLTITDSTILEPLLRLDTPAVNTQISSGESVKIGGWLLNQGGNEKVELYDNNKLIATITSFVTREDVYRAYPEYGIHNAGYTTNYVFSEGTHTLKVVGTGKDGKQFSLTRSFNVGS